MNKKIYITPATQVVIIATANIIAASPAGGQVYGTQAESGSAGFSRRGGGFWDDEEDE